MFGFFKKKKKVSIIDEKLKEILTPAIFPNGMQDIEAGADMLLYIIKNALERDLAKSMFASSLIIATNQEPFNLEKLKEHINLYELPVFNEVQFKNLYNYLHTILTVKMLFKEAPLDVKRVKDLDTTQQELHYKTGNYNTKYVISEDEMPDWAWDAPQVLADLVLTGIANNDQAGHYDEIPEGTGKFGWEVTNPIPVNGIPANDMYLSQLVTEDGKTITWQRKGSFSSENIGGMIDKYEIFSGRKKSLGFLYISPYHKKLSTKAPEGFRFR